MEWVVLCFLFPFCLLTQFISLVYYVNFNVNFFSQLLVLKNMLLVTFTTTTNERGNSSKYTVSWAGQRQPVLLHEIISHWLKYWHRLNYESRVNERNFMLEVGNSADLYFHSTYIHITYTLRTRCIMLQYVANTIIASYSLHFLYHRKSFYSIVSLTCDCRNTLSTIWVGRPCSERLTPRGADPPLRVRH